MRLAQGTRLAHYEVISLLGKGGMGEVYLTQDIRLGRQVALKVLPAAT
jgi:eukaryotic-like serine/threonine-protein kinase